MPRRGSDALSGAGTAAPADTVALLGALCFFLSALELLVPRPLPFMRIGLANMPLLLGVRLLRVGDFALLVLLKIVGQALVGGTFLSFVFLFSIAGTVASAAVMYAAGRIPRRLLGLAGIGCLGAMVSNGAQILVAAHPALFGQAARLLMPPFLAAGFVAGIVLGLVCERFCRGSRWYAQAEGRAPSLEPPPPAASPPSATAPRALRPERGRRPFDRCPPRDLFFAGIALAAVFMLTRSLPGHILQVFPRHAPQFLLFCLVVAFSGRRHSFIVTAIFMTGVVLLGLVAPHGRVLLSLGPLTVAEGSLRVALDRAVTLAGLMMLSRAFVRSDLRLPGAFGALLAHTFRTLEAMRGATAARAVPGRGLGFVLARADAVMLEVSAATPGDAPPREEPRRGVGGTLLLFAIAAAAVALAGIGGR